MKYFNPRTREECDPSDLEQRAGRIINFNPRTREECDDNKNVEFRATATISIHALARSATTIVCYLSDIKLFQSTHSRGVRPQYIVSYCANNIQNTLFVFNSYIKTKKNIGIFT